MRIGTTILSGVLATLLSIAVSEPVRASGPTDWRGFMALVAGIEKTRDPEIAKARLPDVQAYLESDPARRWVALRVAVDAYGDEAGQLVGLVRPALDVEPADDAKAEEMKSLGRSVATRLGLVMAILYSPEAEAIDRSRPAAAGMAEGLLRPVFPEDVDPLACFVYVRMGPLLPEWGSDEAIDARIVSFLGQCPGADLGMVEKGLSDERPALRRAALEAWTQARRRNRPAGAIDGPGASAIRDAVLAGRIPMTDRSPTSLSMAAGALVATDTAEETLAELGNVGRTDEYRALSSAVRVARRGAPAGSLREMLGQ